jgi:alpha/beta hydrolase family protein
MWKRILLGLLAAIFLGVGAFLFGLRMVLHSEAQKPGKFPEQMVFVRSTDDVVSGGVLFTPPKQSSKPLAIIWVHGWGANFYVPSYVGIGRALAERGFTTISVNTRMHDIGNVEKYTLLGKRVRGGGYWGVTSEDARDITAWIGFAEQLGYRRVALVGHSAGWASVGRYEADSKDQRSLGWSSPHRRSALPRWRTIRSCSHRRRSWLLREPATICSGCRTARFHPSSARRPTWTSSPHPSSTPISSARRLPTSDHASKVSDPGILRIERRHRWREGARSVEVFGSAPFSWSAQSGDDDDCEW